MPSSRMNNVISQVTLCVATFFCVIFIARYDHNPNGSTPVFLSPAERNATHEHICKISAREADIPVGPLRYFIPNFLLCPATYTFIGICIVFIGCMIKWSSFYSDSPTETAPMILVFLLLNIKWSRFLESIQMLLPMCIWTGYFARAIFDPFCKWAMPGVYEKLMAHKREREKRAEERWKNRRVTDVEAGQIDEGSPLTETHLTET